METANTDLFYDTISVQSDFEKIVASDNYVSLPDDWFLGLADLENSTRLIEEGKYKTVNTVGAAIISAQINTYAQKRFPFVFGGDGATFAMPPSARAQAEKALDAVRRWTLNEFGLVLRTATFSMSDIRKAGFDVGVARHEASNSVDYAMFAGGGVSWAENEMKQGKGHVAQLDQDNLPDLTGLSCRWTPITSQKGSVLSVVVAPRADADRNEVEKVFGHVVALASQLDRGGHPAMASGPSFTWPPAGLELEARAGDASIPLWRRKMMLYLETFIALIFFKTSLKVGGFDPVHYTKTSGANADFRKFEDALMMTIDCDAKTQKALSELLADAEKKEIIRYGIVEQNEALMTCIVPSVMSDDHMHFIDGASGGYATAAARIKQLRARTIRPT